MVGERLRLLAEFARRLPSSRSGERLNRATLWRWALCGVRRGRRLRTVELGGGRVTCDAWVWEILTQASTIGSGLPRSTSIDQHERARIARELGVSTDDHRAV